MGKKDGRRRAGEEGRVKKDGRRTDERRKDGPADRKTGGRTKGRADGRKDGRTDGRRTGGEAREKGGGRQGREGGSKPGRERERWRYGSFCDEKQTTKEIELWIFLKAVREASREAVRL